MKSRKTVCLKSVCYAILFVYILFLMKIVLFKYTGIQKLAEEIMKGNLEGFRSFNLIPFCTFQEFGNRMANGEFYRGFVNLAGNIVVFIPLGYFLPLLFEKCRKMKVTLLIGFTVSCLFEICQYIFYLGSMDIDDIILNVFGAILGYVCYQWIKKLTKEKESIQYTTTIFLSILGFTAAFFIAVNYFGLMFGVKNGAEYDEKYDESIKEELEHVQIEATGENELKMLGDIVSLEGDTLIINQVIELDDNNALSSNDNRNLKTVSLLPATQYSQMNVYDLEGKKVERKDGEKEDLQEGKRIDIKGYMDGEEFFATEIVINNYLSLCQP